MKKLFQILAIVVIIASASFRAKAQTVSPEYRQAVAEMLKLTNARQATEETLVSTYDNMGIHFTIPTSEVVSIMIGNIWDKALDDYAAIYSKYYTLDELRQLCDFYKSPLGEKVAKYTPEINRDSITTMQKYESDFTSVIMKYIRR